MGKIILGAGLVLSLLAALLVGGGACSRSETQDQALGQLVEEKIRGAAFGKSTDNDGCFAESLQRHDSCGTFLCHLRNNVFLLACLGESTPTPGFCEDVPAKTEFVKTVLWRVSSCSEAGREGSHCHTLVGTLQRFCSA